MEQRDRGSIEAGDSAAPSRRRIAAASRWGIAAASRRGIAAAWR
jgi:hypothetical protein